MHSVQHDLSAHTPCPLLAVRPKRPDLILWVFFWATAPVSSLLYSWYPPTLTQRETMGSMNFYCHFVAQRHSGKLSARKRWFANIPSSSISFKPPWDAFKAFKLGHTKTAATITGGKRDPLWNRQNTQRLQRSKTEYCCKCWQNTCLQLEPLWGETGFDDLWRQQAAGGGDRWSDELVRERSTISDVQRNT